MDGRLMSPAASSPDAHTIQQRMISCRLCQQRKVKCDKAQPACSYCIRHKCECIYAAPNPPKRRKRKSPEEEKEELCQKLQHYEELLYAHNIPLDDDVGSPKEMKLEKSKVEREMVVLGRPPARFIHDGGKSNFIESGLWNSLSEELQGPKDMIRLNRLNSESVINAVQSENVFSASNLALNGAPGMTTAEIKAAHPSAGDIFRLWQIFLDNVNPLTKLIHAPTMQRQLFESVRGHENNSKEFDVMLFAIYLAAIQSMSRHEVQDTFGETKGVLLRRYQVAIRAALVRADFTNTPDLLIVQAFVLYLQSIREYTEPNSLWILTGIGVRLAQRLGLHRDGSLIGISPFETEIRRRVWWNLVGIDSRTAEACGAGLGSNPPKGDTKPYLNINDSDLNPKMSVPPQEHEGATEMMFCKLQNSIGHFLRHSKECGLYHIVGQPQQGSQTLSFDELEATCENKYFKHCDPSVPFHLFTLLLGKATIMVLRLIVRHPRSFGMQIPHPTTAKEREDMWTICVRILEMYNNTLETEAIKQFLWYVNVHFQWHAFVIVTHELCHRIGGDEADKGWHLIERLFDHNPDVLTNKNTGLHKAVLRLVLKAWAARAKGLQKAGKQYEVPKFVAILQSQAPSASQGENFVTNLPGGASAYIGDPQSIQKEMQPPRRDYAGAMSTPESGTTDFLTTPIDWNEWDNLLSGFEYQANTFMDPYTGN